MQIKNNRCVQTYSTWSHIQQRMCFHFLKIWNFNNLRPDCCCWIEIHIYIYTHNSSTFCSGANKWARRFTFHRIPICWKQSTTNSTPQTKRSNRQSSKIKASVSHRSSSWFATTIIDRFAYWFLAFNFLCVFFQRIFSFCSDFLFCWKVVCEFPSKRRILNRHSFYLAISTSGNIKETNLYSSDSFFH